MGERRGGIHNSGSRVGVAQAIFVKWHRTFYHEPIVISIGASESMSACHAMLPGMPLIQIAWNSFDDCYKFAQVHSMQQDRLHSEHSILGSWSAGMITIHESTLDIATSSQRYTACSRTSCTASTVFFCTWSAYKNTIPEIHHTPP